MWYLLFAVILAKTISTADRNIVNQQELQQKLNSLFPYIELKIHVLSYLKYICLKIHPTTHPY